MGVVFPGDCVLIRWTALTGSSGPVLGSLSVSLGSVS